MFEAVFEEVIDARGGNGGKPLLADALATLIEGIKTEQFANDGVSPWYQQGDNSQNVIRSGAKYCGYRVNFAKTKTGVEVWRFAGPYVEMSEADKLARRAKYEATRAANAKANGAAKPAKAKV